MSPKLKVAIIVMVGLAVICVYVDHTRRFQKPLAAGLIKQLKMLSSKSITQNIPVLDTVQVATQVCRDRYGEIVTMLKSMLLITKAHLMLYVFVDQENHKRMNDTLLDLKKKYPDNLTFKILFVAYPGMGQTDFAERFHPCQITRIFFPRLLPDVDSVVYVDTDTLFFRPVEELWFMLHNFNKSQVIGIPPEDPHRTGWYTHVAKHPSYPPTGVNTGVLVMNLTRLRAIDFPSKIVDLYKIWYSKIKWGEQDVVNIWLHYNPEKLYLISCEWNFRNDHCNGGNACKGAEKNGIGILHGNGQQYLIPGKRPELMAINDAFLKYLSSENPKADIAEAVKRNLANVRRVTDCLKALRYIFRDLTLP